MVNGFLKRPLGLPAGRTWRRIQRWSMNAQSRTGVTGYPNTA